MTEEVIEQQPEVKPPPTYRDIVNFDVVKLKKEGLENAPVSDKLFYLQAGDGMFLNRSTLIGRAFVKQKYLPKEFPDLGGEKFTWTSEKIPAEIISKAIHFFRRIYESKKTESEVILLMHPETREWDIYVPVQEVSYSGVSSAVVPDEISTDWNIVGSIHSHCDFGAFHSGVDTGDAEDMDGVHLTFGHVDQDKFEVAAMVMISGSRWDYKDPDEIADFSDTTIEAPIEWDERVVTAKERADGAFKEIFEKYGKKKPVYTTHYSRPYNNNSQVTVYRGPVQGYGNWFDDYDNNWDDDYWKKWKNSQGLDNNYSYKGDEKWKERKAKLDTPHWEDHLEDDVIDAILDCPVLLQSDLDEAFADPARAQNPMFWQGMFLEKLSEIIVVLNKLDFTVDYTVKPKDKGGSADNRPNREKKSKRQRRKERELQQKLILADEEDTDFWATDPTPEGVEITGIPIVDGKTLEERVRDEGFTILEVKDDGKTIVIDVAKV